MNAFELHEKAMHHSFLAKQSRLQNNEDDALEHYEFAANLESEAADYYFDKPDLEPTRSILIRSAAYLNIKAGFTDKAEKYIFFGIINAEDALTKAQLYDALEMCLAFKDNSREEISGNMDYIHKMRQKSIPYVIKPNLPEYGSAVTLDMISDFSSNFTKSLKAFSKSRYKKNNPKQFVDADAEEHAASEFKELVNPVVTSAGFGSFKFSLATDYVSRFGESPHLVLLKSTILRQYHEEVFIKDLTDDVIADYKSQFTTEEIEEIFRPLLNIKSSTSGYTVAYYDRETLTKKYISKAKNKQKVKLLPPRKVTSEDISYLESTLTHTRESETGNARRSTIFKSKMTSGSFDIPSQELTPRNANPVLLNEEIVITVNFDSERGFSFSFNEINLKTTNKVFAEGLTDFYTAFLGLIKAIASKDILSQEETLDYAVIRRLINNPNSL